MTFILRRINEDAKTKGKRKVQGVPQEEEDTDKSKQAQIEQKYEKH